MSSVPKTKEAFSEMLMKEYGHSEKLAGDCAAIVSGYGAFEEETGGEFLQRVGTDGMKWAEEMHKRFPSVPTDELLGWCCNMIEAGRDAGRKSI